MLLNQAPVYLIIIIRSSVTSVLFTIWLIEALHAVKQFNFSRKQSQAELRVPDVYQGVVLESTPVQRTGLRQNWEEGEIQLRCKPDSASQQHRVLRNLKQNTEVTCLSGEGCDLGMQVGGRVWPWSESRGRGVTGVRLLKSPESAGSRAGTKKQQAPR